MNFWWGFALCFLIFVGIPFVISNANGWLRVIICLRYKHLWHVQMMFKNMPKWGRRECLCCGCAENFNPTTGQKHSQLFGAPSYQLWSIKDCIDAKGKCT